MARWMLVAMTMVGCTATADIETDEIEDTDVVDTDTDADTDVACSEMYAPPAGVFIEETTTAPVDRGYAYVGVQNEGEGNVGGTICAVSCDNAAATFDGVVDALEAPIGGPPWIYEAVGARLRFSWDATGAAFSTRCDVQMPDGFYHFTLTAN